MIENNGGDEDLVKILYGSNFDVIEKSTPEYISLYFSMDEIDLLSKYKAFYDINNNNLLDDLDEGFVFRGFTLVSNNFYTAKNNNLWFNIDANGKINYNFNLSHLNSKVGATDEDMIEAC